MNDDDFSGLVRSGSQHSVSVSEHTGNAKTPKNIVVSHEEETEARKRAFEQKALAAMEAEKALAAALAEHVEHTVSDDSTADANIQKVATSQEATNRQSIAGEDAVRPNVQSISTDALEDNHQHISGGNIATNKQSVTGEKAIEANRQGIPTDVIADNVQNIPVSNTAPNRQGIGSQTFADNNQPIAHEAHGLNRQGLDTDPPAVANLQALPKHDEGTNRQSLSEDGDIKKQPSIATDGIDANQQKLPALGAQTNQQAIEPESLDTNRQTIEPTANMAPNHQAIGTDAPSLNRQAAPEDGPLGPNRQALGHKNLESHFEALPSGTIERKKVDFPSGTTTAEKTTITPQTSTKPRPATAGKSKQVSRTPLTAAEQQAAKVKREKMMDEFHGRVAGIKHNVDALNDRLSDFEEQVHKDDAKLIKGDPNDFEVDLG